MFHSSAATNQSLFSCISTWSCRGCFDTSRAAFHPVPSPGLSAHSPDPCQAAGSVLTTLPAGWGMAQDSSNRPSGPEAETKPPGTDGSALSTVQCISLKLTFYKAKIALFRVLTAARTSRAQNQRGFSSSGGYLFKELAVLASLCHYTGVPSLCAAASLAALACHSLLCFSLSAAFSFCTSSKTCGSSIWR